MLSKYAFKIGRKKWNDFVIIVPLKAVVKLKPEKKFRPEPNSHPRSLRYRPSALPTELWRQLGAGHIVSSWNTREWWIYIGAQLYLFIRAWFQISLYSSNFRAYTHNVNAEILVFQNNEKAAMLVYQTNPVGVQLLSYVNTFFCHVVVPNQSCEFNSFLT